MTCTHLVFGLYPCTRPNGHHTPHLAGFTRPEPLIAAVAASLEAA